MLLRFSTVAGRNYRLEQSDSVGEDAAWSAVPGASTVAGTGGIVTVTNFGASALPKRFYRVRLLY